MQELFQKIEEKLLKKEACVLDIVVKCYGSVPREPGAMMLVDKDGRYFGTIGGGVYEYQAIERSKKLLLEHKSCVENFDMTIRNNGMCGGSYDVLMLLLDFTKPDVCQQMGEILAQAKLDQSFQVLFPLAGGLPLLHADVYDAEQYFVQTFNTDGSVYIFGGGHVAQELVPVLAHLDFLCVVMDDREEFANVGVFPQAAKVMVVNYQELEKNIQLKENDYVVIMTRGHQCDTEVERFALQSRAKYIGLMGSKTKKALLRRLLTEEGFTEEQLERVIIPIGLDIKSETPAEIAISIAGQLIQVRAKTSTGAGKYRV